MSNSKNPGVGFNPYRKANGEFASPHEVGENFENKISELEASGDTSAAAKVKEEYDNYVMDNLPESPQAQELFQKRYGAVSVQKVQEAPEGTLPESRRKAVSDSFASFQASPEFENTKNQIKADAPSRLEEARKDLKLSANDNKAAKELAHYELTRKAYSYHLENKGVKKSKELIAAEKEQAASALAEYKWLKAYSVADNHAFEKSAKKAIYHADRAAETGDYSPLSEHEEEEVAREMYEDQGVVYEDSSINGISYEVFREQSEEEDGSQWHLYKSGRFYDSFETLKEAEDNWREAIDGDFDDDNDIAEARDDYLSELAFDRWRGK